MNVAWYSRDGHLEIMARAAAELDRSGGSFRHGFVCHNEVEAEQLRQGHGLEAITVLASELPKHMPASMPSQDELSGLAKRHSAIPLVRVTWSDVFELRRGEQENTRNMVAHLRFWESYLQDNKIDCLVIEVPSILSTCVAWLVCQTLRVRVISPIDIAPLGNRMVLSRAWQGYYPGFNEGGEPGEFEGYSPEAQKYARAYLKRIVERPELTPEVQRRRAAGAYEGMSFKTALKKLPGFYRRRRLKRAYYMSSGGEFWFKRWAKATPNLLMHRLLRPLEMPSDASIKRPYFVMPLHEPHEWSNYTWMGVRYADFESLIREVAASLPPGYELFVKEHSSGFGLRPLGFYRAVKKIPGVRLIHPFADGFKLVLGSQGVVTLGSSMGWEAWLVDRPVILLGEPWYWRLPGIRRARNAEEVARELQDSVNSAGVPEIVKLAAIARLFDISFEATKHPHPDALSDSNVRCWAAAIERDLATIS